MFSNEVDQLCGSEGFKAFCRSDLPSPDQRVICQACGLARPASTSSCPTRRHSEGSMYAELQYVTEPEAVWEAMGHSPWTAPYVWETNYL